MDIAWRSWDEAAAFRSEGSITEIIEVKDEQGISNRNRQEKHTEGKIELGEEVAIEKRDKRRETMEADSRENKRKTTKDTDKESNGNIRRNMKTDERNFILR